MNRYKAISFIHTALLIVAATGCSANVEPDGFKAGTLRLNLMSEQEGAVYELKDATFEIVGETSLAIDTNAEPSAGFIERQLPSGQYSIRLEDGWNLVTTTDGGTNPIDAQLISPNPAGFSIAADTRTQVWFRFQTQAGAGYAGSGTLTLGIEVEELPELSVIFSELMLDPKALPDAEGEWFEVTNTGQQSVNLEGCLLERDATQVAIDIPLEIPAGGQAVFANSAAPGFQPDFAYSKITLPNSSGFILKLMCGTQLLDQISVDPASWPGGAGISASLSGSVKSSAGNDLPANWCDAVAPYTEDLGTPKAPNPPC